VEGMKRKEHIPGLNIPFFPREAVGKPKHRVIKKRDSLSTGGDLQVGMLN